MNTDKHRWRPRTLGGEAASALSVFICSSKPLQFVRPEYPSRRGERAAIDQRKPGAELRRERVAQNMNIARRRAALGQQHEFPAVRIHRQVDDDDRVSGRARMDEDV